jgi:hypothetical protein
VICNRDAKRKWQTEKEKMVTFRCRLQACPVTDHQERKKREKPMQDGGGRWIDFGTGKLDASKRSKPRGGVRQAICRAPGTDGFADWTAGLRPSEQARNRQNKLLF